MVREVVAALGCAIGLGVADGAAAADGVVSAVYLFSWAGMDVGELRAEIVEADGGYRAAWSSRTTGVVGALFPFTATGAAQGRRDGDRYWPRSFDGRSEWRDGGGTWRVEFGPDGRATEVEIPATEQSDREPVPEVLRQGPDPASLALTAIASASAGASLTATGFDGKRAVEFVLACAADLTDAELACTIESHLLAGASRAWRDRQPEPPRPPARVWLGAGGNDQRYWPVRLEVPSRFGGITARLISLEQRAPAAG